MSCDMDGYTSVFWNRYAVLKAKIDTILGDLEITDGYLFSQYKTTIITHFLEVSSEDYYNKSEEGLFDVELSHDEEVKKAKAHNKALLDLRTIVKNRA